MTTGTTQRRMGTVRRLAAAMAVITAAMTPAARGDGGPAADAGGVDFAADLYRRVAADHADGNLALSPASVRTALAMAAAGAAGRTADQLARGLHLTPGTDVRPPADLGPAVAWTAADAVWVDRNLRLRLAFADALHDRFGSAPQVADFAGGPEAARAAVNAWASDHTAGKITGLLPPGSVTAGTRLVLADAVHFKADWADPFEASATRPAAFHLSVDRSADVPMMHGHAGQLPVYRGDGFDAVELAYQGGRAAMLLIVPTAPDGLPAVERQMTGDHLRQWAAGLRPTRAEVSVPKFKVTAAADLAHTLGELGMADAFDPDRADFSAATADAAAKLYVSGVFHKAYVAVDERGTEAAAATGAVMGVAAIRMEEPPLRIVADRPFAYLIRDRRTGAVLFAGRCADPRAD